jgi:pimeloyl-ACP methyl ester carboxylesterase
MTLLSGYPPDDAASDAPAAATTIVSAVEDIAATVRAHSTAPVVLVTHDWGAFFGYRRGVRAYTRSLRSST